MLINTDVLDFTSFFDSVELLTEAAKDKIQRFKVIDPFVIQFINKYETAIYWPGVKDVNDINSQIKTIVKGLVGRIHRDNPSSYYIKDIDLESEYRAHADDPQVQAAWAIFQSDPEKGKKSILKVVNDAKEEAFKRWIKYITKDNEVYRKSPAWQYCILKPIFDLSDDQTKGVVPGCNGEAVAAIYSKIQDSNGAVQFNVAKNYTQYLNAVLTGSITADGIAAKDGWIYIPSKTADPYNFEDNVQKLQSLSTGRGWCTASGMARPYLSKGDFYLYIEGNKAVVAIRLQGNKKIVEIRGKNNADPVSYTDQIKTICSRKELEGANEFLNRAEETKKALIAFKQDPSIRKAVLKTIVIGMPNFHYRPDGLSEDIKAILAAEVDKDLPEVIQAEPADNVEISTVLDYLGDYLVKGKPAYEAVREKLVQILYKRLILPIEDGTYDEDRYKNKYIVYYNLATKVLPTKFADDITYIEELPEVLNAIIVQAKKQKHVDKDSGFGEHSFLNWANEAITLIEKLQGKLDLTQQKQSLYSEIRNRKISLYKFPEFVTNEIQTTFEVPKEELEADIKQMNAIDLARVIKNSPKLKEDPIVYEKALNILMSKPGEQFNSWSQSAHNPSMASELSVFSNNRELWEVLPQLYNDEALAEYVTSCLKIYAADAARRHVDWGAYALGTLPPYYFSDKFPEVKPKWITAVLTRISDYPLSDWEDINRLNDNLKLGISKENILKTYHDGLVRAINGISTSDEFEVFLSSIYKRRSQHSQPAANFLLTDSFRELFLKKVREILAKRGTILLKDIRLVLSEKYFKKKEYDEANASGEYNATEIAMQREKAFMEVKRFIYPKRKDRMSSILNYSDPVDAFLRYIKHYYGVPVQFFIKDPVFMNAIKKVVNSHITGQKVKKADVKKFLHGESFMQFYNITHTVL